MPQPKDVYVDPLLSNISVQYRNEDYIADKIFPTLFVEKKTGFYFKYDKSNLRIPNTTRTGLARANRADYSLSKVAYGPLLEHSLETGIEKDVLDQYQDPLEPRTDATNLVSDLLLLEKEKGLATDLADTSIVTQNVTLSGTSQWSDYSNSTPFVDIQTGIDSIVQNGVGKMPNTIAMGWNVWSKIVNHPDFLDRIKYNSLGAMTTEMFLKLFADQGITNIYISRASENTAAEGQSDSLSFIWGKNVQIMYVNPQPAIRNITAGYHLTLKNGRYIDRWAEIQNKGEYVRANDYYSRQVVAAEAIYLIKNAVA